MTKQEQAAQELTRRAIDALGENGTPLGYVCGWLSGGKTVVQLAEQMTTALKFEITRDTLRRAIYALDTEANVNERLQVARQAGAMILAEEAKSIADDVEAKRDEIAKARLQVDTRQWLAGKFDRAQFGDQKGVNVNVNIGQLHLDSMRRVNAERRVPLPGLVGPAIPDGVAEVVEILDEARS